MQNLNKNYRLIKDLLKKFMFCNQFRIKANTLKNSHNFVNN